MTMIRTFCLLVLPALVLLNEVSAFGPQSKARPWGLPSNSQQQQGSSSSSSARQQQECSSSSSSDEFGPAFSRQRRKRAQRSAPATSAPFSPSALRAAAAAADDSSDDEPVRIIIAGAPASGKGTQCEAIKERYGLVHLSTGDMLREAVAAGTDVGKKAKEYMDAGKLVPDEVIIGVVKDRLSEEDCQTKGWLLDGFPRTPAQAKALEESGISADCFVFLNVPDDILVERVVGRRTDPETGKIYHMTFSPPEDDDVMSRLVQRSDDTEEKVKVRLGQFHANVDAVKDSYTDIGVTIDGNQAPAQVTDEIFVAIESRLKRAAA